MAKVPIGIDIDGVLADFSRSFLRLANTLFGGIDERFQQTVWDYDEVLTKEQQAAVWQRIAQTRNFWLTPGKMAGTSQLCELAGYFQYHFITVRRTATTGGSMYDQTCEWLEKNYGLRYPFVVVCKEKGPIASALGLRAFIDDKVENLANIGQHSNCRLYLRDMAFNSDTQGLPVIRVPDLNTYLEEVAHWTAKERS